MSSPSQPPPSSNGSKHLPVVMPSAPRVMEIAPPPVNAQVNNLAVNLPSTPEATLMAQMSDEKFNITIQASVKLQELALAQQTKRLDLKDQENMRKHERSMKRLDLRGYAEKGSRNFVYIFGIGLALIVFFLLYKEQYTFAIGIVSHVAALVAGYLAGRHQVRKKSQNKADENA